MATRVPSSSFPPAPPPSAAEAAEAEVRLSAAEGYPTFEALVRRRVAEARGPLFATDAAGLFDLFLAALPEPRRRHYDCNCCRRFVERYGGLVTITEDGATVPVLFGGPDRDEPPFFRGAITQLWDRVRKAKVTGVFLSSDATWGTPANVAGPGSKYVGLTWTHLSGPNPAVYSNPVKTADQAMAEKLQDFIWLRKFMDDTPITRLAEAVRVLESDALGRSEKALGQARWLLNLRNSFETVKGRGRQVVNNIVWLAVAAAPPGYCHGNVLGTLLDDIATGLDFEAVRRRWNEKVHPLQYQRPTAVSDGVIQQAEAVIARLGSARALRRRFARMADVLKFDWKKPTVEYCGWCPDPLNPSAEFHPSGGPEHTSPQIARSGGVFDHLKPAIKPTPKLALPPRTMTWEKFAAEALPTAVRLEYWAGAGPQNFYGMVTAADPDAPPILQWDGLKCSQHGHPELKSCPECPARNPVSLYVYHGGSYARDWNLAAGGWVTVKAVLPMPAHWQRPEQFQHHARCALLALDGAKDLRHKAGGGFFPETLRAEYHGVRKAMEAYAQKAEIAGRDEGDANGVALQAQGHVVYRLRVTTADGSQNEYTIDRWE